MSRRLFLLILVAIGLLFSGFMLLAPVTFAQSAGLTGAPETAMVFRALGAMILSVTLVNFLVRDHPDSPTLAAVLWMNVAVHVLATAVDLLGMAQGLLTLAHVLPGAVVHAFAAIGAWVFARRIATG